MDTAFLKQTGVTQGWSFLAPSFYPDAKKQAWLKRVVPFVFANYGKDRIQGGNKYSWCRASACTRRGRASSGSTSAGAASRGRARFFPTRQVRADRPGPAVHWLNVFTLARLAARCTTTRSIRTPATRRTSRSR
jgi:hypothetical protein